MKRTIIAAAAALVLLAASPASAAQTPQGPRPGLGDDIYLYHPILKSVPQNPPLDNLIRFRMEAYTNHIPQTLHIVVHLFRWRSAMQLKRPRGAWIEIWPSVRYGLADIPAVGRHEYLEPPAQWTCLTGRLFIKVHGFGIMHDGQPDSVTAYFPWAGFTKKDLDKGNVHKRPSLKEAWHTDCQGDDTLIG